jgi:hypothetical protein
MGAQCPPHRAAVLAALAARVDQGKHTTWLVDRNHPDPARRMQFWLGGHRPYWLSDSPVPMFISANTLRDYKGRDEQWPIARRGGVSRPWALDSGGFTALRDHGGWRLDADDYGSMVVRLMDECGMIRPDFAAPQDWMCEPWVIAGGVHNGQRFAGTGLNTRLHIEFTVENFLYLREEFYFVPWIPVLQGFHLDDYLLCEQMYLDAGVDLKAGLVGLGSVCRREATAEIEEIVRTFHAKGYRLHGFGVKTDGLRRYGRMLASADSMAWSRVARLQEIRLPDTPWGACTHPGVCNNCLRWALVWRELVLAGLHGDDLVPDLDVLEQLLSERDEQVGQLALDFNLIGCDRR